MPANIILRIEGGGQIEGNIHNGRAGFLGDLACEEHSLAAFRGLGLVPDLYVECSPDGNFAMMTHDGEQKVEMLANRTRRFVRDGFTANLTGGECGPHREIILATLTLRDDPDEVILLH